MIIIYSTGCPKCKVLEAKIASKFANYHTCEDLDIMEQKGIMSVPTLEIDGEMMDFSQAIAWVNAH